MAGYDSTLKKYLQAMNSSNSDKVNQVNTNDLASLTEEDKNKLNTSKTIKTSDRSLQGETHQDDKAFLERSRDTLRSVNLNVFKGMLDFFDSIGDAVMGAVGSVASWVGNDDLSQKMTDAINYDWTTQGSEIVYDVTGGALFDSMTGNADKVANAYDTTKARQDFEDTTTGNYNENIENVVNSVEQGVGSLVPSLITGQVVGSALSGATEATQKSAKLLTQVALGTTRGIGSGYEKVASDGGDLGKGAGYAAIKGILGGLESGFSYSLGTKYSDKLTNALGSKVTEKVFGETGKKALSNFLGNVTSVISSTAIDTAFNVAEQALDPALQMIYNSNALDEAYGSEEARQKTLTNIAKGAITSAVSSGLMASVKALGNVDGSKKDYVAENTQKVIDETPELKEAQEKVLNLQEQITQTIQESNELDEELKSENVTEERKQEIINEKSLNASFVESASTEMAKASDTLLQGIVKETINNKNVLTEVEKVSNVHDTTSALLKDNTSEADIDGFKKVDGLSVKETENNSLEYKPEQLTETTKAIEYVKRTDDSVIVKGSMLGLNVDNDYVIKGGDLSEKDLDIVATCLKDTNSTYKVSGKNNQTFIEYSNGTKLLFENNILKKVNGTTPTWATLLKADNANNAPEAMKKDSAENGYVTKKNTIEAINTLNKSLLDTGFFKNVDKQAQVLNTAWDFATDDENKKKAVTDFVQQLVKKNNIKNGVTIQFKDADDFFYQTGIDREEAENTIFDYLKENEKLSTKDKASLKLEETSLKYQALIQKLANSQTTLNRFHKTVLQVRNRVKKTNEPISAGNPNSKNELKGYAKQVFNSISTFSGNNGKISAKRVFTALYGNKTASEIDYNTKLEKYNAQLNDLSEKLKSIDDHESEEYVTYDSKYKLVEEKRNNLTRNWKKLGSGVHNLDFEYEKDSYGDEWSQDTKDIIDHLKSKFDSKTGKYIIGTTEDGKPIVRNDLSIEDTQLLTGVLKQLLDQNSTEYQTKLRQEKAEAYTIQEEAKAVISNRKNVNLTKTLTGQIYNLKDMFGEHSQFYKTCVSDVIKDHQAQAKNKYLYMKALTNAQETYNIKDSDLTGKQVESNLTEMASGATRTIKLNKGYLMELYAQSLSSENRMKMEDDGFQIDGVKYKFDDTTRKTIASSLTENERNFAKSVFQDGYNGVAHKALSDYSINKFGYDYFESNGDYMNRNMGNLNFTATNRDEMLGTSLGANKLKTRTNNKNPILIEGFASHYEKYCGIVADYVSSDNVRKLNSLINLNDRENKQNLVTILSQLDTKSNSGGSFFENWVNSANNVNTLKDGTSILNKVYSNAMSVPITLNVGTFAKMYLDPVRMAKLDGVGLGKVAKGYIKGVLSHFSSGNEDIVLDDGTASKFNSKQYFKEHSATYIKANQEDYAIKNNVIASNYSNITKFLGKGLEVANNDMMSSIAYEICKEKIKAESPDISETDLAREATDYFDSISSMSLSNSDNLDTSDLRSGRNGSITRAIFGIFGGDNQKKMEYWHEMIMGTAHSKKRLEAYTSQQESIRKRSETNTNEINRLNSELEEMETNGVEKYTDGETKLVKERKIQDLQNDNQSLTNAYNSLRENIADEQSYASPKRVAKRVGTIGAIFITSAILEEAINIGNNKLKGKDFDWKDSVEDLAYDATIGGLPILSTIGSAIRYDSSLSTLQTDGLNNMISTFSSIISLKDSNTPEARRKVLNNSIISMGSLLGLPVKNLEEYVIGAVKNINTEVGMNLSTLLKGYSSSYLKKQSQTYLASGNLTKATETTQANLGWFKTGKASWKVAKEITQLSAIPRDVPNTLDNSQKNSFKEVYSLSNSAVEKLISSSSYRSKDDNGKKSAIMNLYNAYYQIGMNRVDSENYEISTQLQKALYTYLYNKSKLTTAQKQLLKEYGYSF